MKTVEERFESRVDRSGDCHVWMAATDSGGYGQFWVSGRLVMVHRWAYEHYVGPIPEGLRVLHRCDNPPCVNPDHLFLGTDADNMADRGAKGRQARGEKHGRAKINEDDVREIRRRAAGGEIQRTIADDYAVSRRTVSDIVTHKSWAHIESERYDR